ncbi:hypothetical protein A3A60_02200 [Candidatus Curtissbacteria bacterium RIFCSPLOWO2_01_FULL_42_26]|uniref:Nudix hydrolase domain-containing protein n=1 Tax=Candidatus Curtissbacteria bacterium RIFCSPLOWO2_01_FULL_42_26 TaxID=1797729 RepID=A0A1F5HYS1_9BACT|nr:MAG: hypothetical protein A3A60_02200 [Candidatus Curtissbacteria bacterium RIFCSPLOWO2_01_FULL_42_26]
MSIKRVYSAGGIVLRIFAPQDKSFEQIEGEVGNWKVLVTQHSKHKGWDFPKGHIEVGETSEKAALREVKEETGVKAEIIEKVGQTQYFYWDEGAKVLKTVTFFLMKYISDGEATTAFEVSDHKWLKVDEVEGQLTFKDTKALWQKARERVESLELRD